MTSVSIEEDLARLEPDVAVVAAVFEGDKLDDAPRLTALGGDALGSVLSRSRARFEMFETTLLHSPTGGADLLLIGGGKSDAASPTLLYRLAAAASRFLTGKGYSRIAFVHGPMYSSYDFARAVTQGLLDGAYDPALMKSNKPSERRLDEVALVATQGANDEMREGAKIAEIIAASSRIARDLVNLPPNEITPSALAKRAEQLARDNGLTFEALDEKAMRDLGMGSLLGVASGSEEPPRAIIMRYGSSSQPDLAVVGKGITFDSGGLSLKTAEGMETMKGDMAGGAAVIAAMVAVGRLRPDGISIMGIVGTTENMPSGSSMRPGDVLRAMNGKTIEVLNTDAEGRLVLADVLAYAVSKGARRMVDLATLTGAASVSLGPAATLAAGKPLSWVNEVVEVGNESFEPAWAMPLFPEYRRAMDSEIADLKNSGGRQGGALNATAFLSEFVDDVPWTHLDIAPTSWDDKGSPWRAKAATGVGVGTIVNLVRKLAGASVGATA